MVFNLTGAILIGLTLYLWCRVCARVVACAIGTPAPRPLDTEAPALTSATTAPAPIPDFAGISPDMMADYASLDGDDTDGDLSGPEGHLLLALMHPPRPSTFQPTSDPGFASACSPGCA